MELFTSRWANRDLAHLDVTPVGISRGVPRWRLPYRYKKLPMLAPSREAFRIEDPKEFERVYRTELEEIGAERITQALRVISQEHGGKPLVCLCWERSGEFCHRRVWADWWLEQTGQRVPELEANAVVEQHKPAQKTLFDMEGE